ncbi:MAG TPA: 4a-hydroxytetrahydrobiopterin dehydratase [Flavobacterium sp.]|uniref:4a-hydroxytetrahydrobiopterin dehydratase n=1 Tax=Flavobacterium sp. TaxID=239 RepID=UPI002C809A86|nr:4a-hydroxytetrahydrobiopterin dehydratase [Flavobacterium sp.]HSD13963.1 4a-hydroxytetrahydrobiopterin dehydratase [Flavobacterium sp.]
MTTNNNAEWIEENNKLYKSFLFNDFSQAFGFMTRVALIAQQLDHHPTWTNTWNKVEIWLSTHSAGNVVTSKDRELASKIDSLV